MDKFHDFLLPVNTRLFFLVLLTDNTKLWVDMRPIKGIVLAVSKREVPQPSFKGHFTQGFHTGKTILF